jgi:hypothetical protein
MGPCYRCGGPHLIASCPELRPASSRKEHEWRIAEYQRRFQNWLEGIPGTVKWDPETKKNAIEQENRTWQKEMAGK